jgi:hypothetical protein
MAILLPDSLLAAAPYAIPSYFRVLAQPKVFRTPGTGLCSISILSAARGKAAKILGV